MIGINISSTEHITTLLDVSFIIATINMSHLTRILSTKSSRIPFVGFHYIMDAM